MTICLARILCLCTTELLSYLPSCGLPFSAGGGRSIVRLLCCLSYVPFLSGSPVPSSTFCASCPTCSRSSCQGFIAQPLM